MTLIETLRADLIGRDAVIPGPFGDRRLVYADYMASGRGLRSVERFLKEEILPFYANPHSRQSFTGRQTGMLVEEAREIISRSVGACTEDAVLFCGTGATDAIAKLVGLLDLAPGKAHMGLSDSDRPVVIIGPYEHHSNELPWRECAVDLVVLPEDDRGLPCVQALEATLKAVRPGRWILGSFSAASNVTGIRSPIATITRLLHEHGGLCFWDFAAAGPYDPIEMSVGPDRSVWKDAVFISPHKFVGGPDTYGILVVKRAAVRRQIACKPGGGTVQFVAPDRHLYHDDLERREEGGTPAAIAAMRTALAFRIKDQIGTETIRAIEDAHIERAMTAWAADPNILMLGRGSDDRLAVFSLMIRSGARFLHHAFVVQLLNDLFGIQVRGGLFCAGPYAHRLLGIDKAQSAAIFEQTCPGCRPGFVRLNLHYLMSEEEVALVIGVVQFIARRGADFLPLYEFDMETGRWRHRAYGHAPVRRLAEFEVGARMSDERRAGLPLDMLLGEAERLADAAKRAAGTGPCGDGLLQMKRWFAVDGDETGRPAGLPVAAGGRSIAEAFQAAMQ